MKFAVTIIALLAACLLPESNAAVQFYGVSKTRRFHQTSAAAPTLRATQGHRGHAFLYSTVGTTASVRNPRSTTRNLQANGDHIGIIETFDTTGQVDLPWPTGTYTLAFQNGTDGSRSSSMFLGTDTYPVAPRISNYNDLQSVSHTQPVTIRWDNLGIPGNDIARVRVDLNGVTIFETPAIPGAAGTLTATATSVTIPSGRLLEGEVYTGALISHRGITRDTTTLPGALGWTGYAAETTFTIRTRWTQLDVAYYNLEKRVRYAQTSAAPATPQADNPFELIATAIPSTFQSVDAASLTPPAGGIRNFTRTANVFAYAQRFPTHAALQTAYPAGNYLFSFATRNNGARTNTFNYAADAYPNPPQITNFDAAQQINPAQPFALSWSIPGATAADHVQLLIQDGASQLVATPLIPGAVGALTGAATAHIVPANTFQRGRTYTATLICSRHTTRDTINYNGVLGSSGFSRATSFTMATPLPSPTISNMRRVGDQTEFTFDNLPGQTYTLQFSEELPAWTTLHTTNANTTPLTVRFAPATGPYVFYRLIVGN